MRLSSSSTRRMRRCRSGMLRNLRRCDCSRTRGKTKREQGAAIARPIDSDAAAVGDGDLFHDGQAEAAAANAIGPAAAVERLEEVRQIARGDAGPAIFNGDYDVPIIRGRAYAHPFAGRAVTDGVGDE